MNDEDDGCPMCGLVLAVAISAVVWGAVVWWYLS